MITPDNYRCPRHLAWRIPILHLHNVLTLRYIAQYEIKPNHETNPNPSHNSNSKSLTSHRDLTLTFRMTASIFRILHFTRAQL